MKHAVVVEETDIEGVIFIYKTHTFTTIFNILKIVVNVEQRNKAGTNWKHFVSIKLFGKTVIEWQYRDEYERQYYINKDI